MEKNYYSFFIFLLLFAFVSATAQDAPVATFKIPSQNNLKYNRFLQNPAFSFVREDNTYLSLYHRNQWVQFDDSPKVYLASYSGKFSERSGLGIGLYQQNLGIIVSFGGIANFSYNVKITEKMNLTLGFNLAYYNSGIDRNKSVTEEPDPVLLSMQNNSLLSINPGFNLSYGRFDFGAYAENMVDYDFKSSKMAKEYAEKAYTAQLMYSQPISGLKNLLEGTNVRLALRAKETSENGLNLNGSVLFDLPEIGWIQAGMDDFYGLGTGLGFYFTKRLALGYTYEKGLKDGLSNLGATHEITMAFSFNDRAALPVIPAENTEDELLESEEKTPAFDKDLEIEKLRNLLDETHMHLLDLLAKEDSLAVIRKEEFDEKIKNLMEYATRENNAREERLQKEKIEKVKGIVTEEQAKKEAETKMDQEIKALYAGAKPAKQSPKKGNKFTFENVAPGHYIIANVFSDELNAEKFIEKMKAKGMDAGFIDNPINGFRYVYLSRHILWKDALIAYYSNLGNAYFETVWIMSINTN